MSIDWFDCQRIVSEKLFQLDWRLSDGTQLARDIWTQVGASAASASEIERQLYGRYAEILHAACGDSEQRERAFAEMREWLFDHSQQLIPYAGLRDDIVQQVMVELTTRFPQRPLRTPRTLWAYLLTITRNKLSDSLREEKTQKRGGGRLDSLEALAEQTGPEVSWEDLITDREGANPSPEELVAKRDIEEKIRQVLEDVLSSPLQQAVMLGVLQGLKPRELAEQLDKKPHEIRMAKARALNTLRNLPAEILRPFLSLLGG